MKSKHEFLREKNILMLCLFILVSVSYSFAQQLTMTGKVVDEDGQPLPGVTVIKQGTSVGAVTNIDGVYSMADVDSETTLIFSFIGMATQEILVGNQTVIDVTMLSDSQGLEEVVIVGFGTQKKATLTGAVSQVKGEEMLKGKGTSSAALAMQGEIPGVVVTRTSPRPGNEGTDIKIRGDMSVNGINPLIILDGLEIPEWQLSTINSQDIETYSVIKDGAAAIFGTKAAGGVILITTKRGKKGKLQVEYQGDMQLNMPFDMPLADIYEWGEMWYVGGNNLAIDYVNAEGETVTAGYGHKFFSREQFGLMAEGNLPTEQLFGAFDFQYDDLDYFDLMYGTTLTQRHNVSISGGSERATHRTSLGYSNERSTLEWVYDGAKKYNFRTNLNYEFSDLLSTEINVSYDNRLIDEPTSGVGTGVRDPWLWPVHNPAGNYYQLWGADVHAFAQLEDGGRTTTNQEIFRIGGKVTLDFNNYAEGLKFVYQGNVSSRRSDKTARRTTVSVYDWDDNLVSTNPSQAKTYVDIDLEKKFFQNHVVQGLYNRSFNNHNVGVMVGMTAEESQYNKWGLKRTNLTTDDLDDINTGDGETQTNHGGSNAVGLVSYIARLNYDYNGIYMVEGTARRDGSSRLHPDYRWANFFYGSAGIRLSEMSFMKGGIFDNLKIRASYGETGSTKGIDEYDYISTMSTGTTYFGSTASMANTANISAMTSTDRTWERVVKSNIAVDFAVLDNKLSGTVELYKNTNNDMLIEVTYPQVLGATAPKTNSGDFETKGWEASLNWRDKVGQVRYNVGLSMWDSRSEVTSMEGKTVISYGVNKIVEGDPLNSIYVYRTDGLFQTEQEVLDYYNNYGFASAVDQFTYKTGSFLSSYQYRSASRLMPGCVRRVDTNGDEIISLDDLDYYGDANPHYSFGINMGLEWKGIDFSMFFQGVGQQNIVRTGTLAYPFKAWYMNQNKTWIGKTWTTENTSAKYPIMLPKDGRNNWNYQHTNDINVINAWYVRAKVMSLGYTIPKSVVQNFGFERLRVSSTGNDLFVISNVEDGLDPEQPSDAHNGDAYPFNSTLMFSLQATF